jgi:hypothetical protein
VCLLRSAYSENGHSVRARRCAHDCLLRNTWPRSSRCLGGRNSALQSARRRFVLAGKRPRDRGSPNEESTRGASESKGQSERARGLESRTMKGDRVRAVRAGGVQFGGMNWTPS